jgi:radical SAM protein with 4Fe4S-binding SPASM domain
MVYLQVSLDGRTSTTNDLIRGAGTFNRIIKALEQLSVHEIPFSINTVLTKLNFPEISSVYSIAKDYGAKLRISRFRPSGRGKISWEYLRLGKDDLKAFSQWLSNHKDVVTGDSFFSLEQEERKTFGLNLCGAAKFTCCINPEGSMYPCAFLQDTVFWGGNLLDQSLGEIWSHAQVFKLLRNLRVQSCESCFRFEVCLGGCPAVAYFTEKSLNIPDPECLVYSIQIAQ